MVPVCRQAGGTISSLFYFHGPVPVILALGPPARPAKAKMTGTVILTTDVHDDVIIQPCSCTYFIEFDQRLSFELRMLEYYRKQFIDNPYYCKVLSICSSRDDNRGHSLKSAAHTL